MKYSDIVDFSKTFQNSVNIDFDLHKQGVISSFVPTSDTCEVIKQYLDNIVGGQNHSTFLIGPYGKGKSFLILTLLQLISGISSKSDNKTILKNIKSLNEGLYGELSSFLEEGRKYLPVVINPGHENLKQAFMVALKTALDDAGCSSLVPESSYDECLAILERWESDEAIRMGALFTKCCKDIDKLKAGLRRYSSEAYREFIDVYNCVSVGQKFNPLIDDNVARLYEKVAAELRKTGKFDGIFVVFDEFSKFLEDNSKSLSEELRFIQDFAEKANRSDKNYDIHLCCIAHKPISLYSEKGSGNRDLLKTVEGRFLTIKFNRELSQYFELISSSIIKKEGYHEVCDSYYAKHEKFYKDVASLPIFAKTDNPEAAFKSCFPLNPVCAYALVKVSELVAQNERTLFTFLTGYDSVGLRHFVAGNSNGLLSVDEIYDYFEEQIRNDPSDNIKDIYYMSSSLLKNEDGLDEESIKFIKALATILIIDDKNYFKSDFATIALALGYENANSAKKIAEKLIEKGLINESLLDHTLSFPLLGSQEINLKVDSLLQSELKKKRYIDALNESQSKDYYLPNVYNSNKRMVRFFRYIYVDYNDFLKLSSLRNQLTYDGDAYIVRILGDGIDSEEVMRKIAAFNLRNVIYQIGKQTRYDAISRLALRVAALKRIQTMDANGNDRSLATAKTMLDKSLAELASLLRDEFCDSEFLYFHELAEKTNAHRANEVLKEIYPRTPVFNNELINRRTPSVQYAKARDLVVDFLLSGKDGEFWEESKTSPQNTVKRAFEISLEPGKGGREIVDEIKELVSSDEEKIDTKGLLNRLVSHENGIGMRHGIVPLFVAEACKELVQKDNSIIILYFRGHEVEFNSANLAKAFAGGEGYYLKYNRGAADKQAYLEKMIPLFGGKAKLAFKENVSYLLDLMVNWARNLPTVVRTGNNVSTYGLMSGEHEKFLIALRKYDLNPYETIFELPIRIFGQHGYEELFKKMEGAKKRVESLPNAILEKVKGDVIEVFGFPTQGSLQGSFNNFLSANSFNPSSFLGSSNVKSALISISTSNHFDDKAFVNDLSTNLISIPVYDWNVYSGAEFKKALSKMRDEVVENGKNETASGNAEILSFVQAASSDDNHSPMAVLLKNQVEETIKSFGESINKSDVIYVFANLIKELDI